MVDHTRVHYRNKVDFSVTTTHLDIKQLLVMSAHWKSNNRTFILRSVPCSAFSWFSISYVAWKVQVSFNTLPAGSNPSIRRLSVWRWIFPLNIALISGNKRSRSIYFCLTTPPKPSAKTKLLSHQLQLCLQMFWIWLTSGFLFHYPVSNELCCVVSCS